MMGYFTQRHEKAFPPCAEISVKFTHRASTRPTCIASFSERHFIRSTLARGASSFVVNLGGSDVAMAEQFPDFHDVDARIEKQRGGGGAERMRRIDAFPDLAAVRQFALANGIRQLTQVLLQDSPPVAASSSVCEWRRGPEKRPLVSFARSIYS